MSPKVVYVLIASLFCMEKYDQKHGEKFSDYGGMRLLTGIIFLAKRKGDKVLCKEK